ncbi:hypothetical protein MTR_4g114560 [Medicago truncatula]|uniref:Uncharacterized protein n=1 Tax=Medicago truncatula TaxID=3880 RepID=G7JD01_MEDTR|nr:hypothetical protein MTR_4g114560 [Medicago truncatula]
MKCQNEHVNLIASRHNFKIMDLGILKYFLGLEVACSKQSIFISWIWEFSK